MPYLEVLNGPEVGFKANISQETFFIGRDPNNHLVLSDRTVSRKHAVINQLEGKFIVSDLKSLKGLLINGNKKGEATLDDGDEIAVGAVRLRFYIKGTDSMLPKRGFRRWKKGLFLFLMAALVLGAGTYFWPSDTREIEKHYRNGVALFNERRDLEGAEREWRKVLELDPDKKTPYAQKAAKFLETLPGP
ncbi:MAG: FHA domain-containing protein [Deltaproteobacteria bacterium]|nr:FHA domain-containing protein [Deltaproteobacteria bacterium]